MDIYESEHTMQVKQLHKDVLAGRLDMTIGDELSGYFENLSAAFAAGNPATKVELGNWHPGCIGKSLEETLAMSLGDGDFRLTIARAYGFKDWVDVQQNAEHTHNREFETAVDYLLRGDGEKLSEIVDAHPELLESVSAYGHKARLIHYVGSNGVEIWRQVVPENLPEMLKLLLDAGSDPDPPSNIYGGEGNLEGLIKSSAHPYEAGVTTELLKVLRT